MDYMNFGEILWCGMCDTKRAIGKQSTDVDAVAFPLRYVSAGEGRYGHLEVRCGRCGHSWKEKTYAETRRANARPDPPKEVPIIGSLYKIAERLDCIEKMIVNLGENIRLDVVSLRDVVMALSQKR